MSKKTKIEVFKPGDIVYFTSSSLKCSCLAKIISVTKLALSVKCILYNCGIGYGKNYDRGCSGLATDGNCTKKAWKVSQPCHEFMKLFINENVKEKDR